MSKKKRSKKSNKPVEPICNNCLCYDRSRGECKVVVFINGNRFRLPVFPGDHCHMDELGIEVKEVRWWVEDENNKPTKGNGTVKIEYPKDSFFSPDVEKYFPDAPEKPPLPPAE
jgi:hypothetical protein